MIRYVKPLTFFENEYIYIYIFLVSILILLKLSRCILEERSGDDCSPERERESWELHVNDVLTIGVYSEFYISMKTYVYVIWV